MTKVISGDSSPMRRNIDSGPLSSAVQAASRYKRIKIEANTLHGKTEAAYEATRLARHARDEARGALDSAEAKQAPNVAEFRADYEFAKAAYDAAQAAYTDVQARLNSLKPIVAEVDRFLAAAQREGRAFEDMAVEARADVGDELAALMAERAAIMELPDRLEDAIAIWESKVDKWAHEGRPKAHWRVDDVLQSRGKYLVHRYAAFDIPKKNIPNAALKDPRRDIIPSSDNALAMLCWFDPDRMKAHFRSELERLYGRLDRDGMSHSEKAEAVAELDGQILQLQRAECAAAFLRPELVLRAGLDPRAVLGVREV